MKKRLLSLLLALVMVLGMVPTSVFAVDGIPFTVTVGGEEVTEITEGVVSWTDWSGTPSDVTCYTVTVPQGATEAALDFGEDMQWMYYDSQGNYIGQGDSSTTSQASHTVAIQDSNSDGELDGISVQAPDSWSTSYYIQFVYAAGEQTSCLTALESAPATDVVSAGGLYKLNLQTVFADAEGHSLEYNYTISPVVENEHTKIANGEFCFTAQELGDYEVTLSAECASGKKAEHKLTLTVEKASEGIAAQYGYDETDKSTVTVYVNISNDGMPLGTQDGTVLANLKVTVPYFDLGLYGMEQFNRYGTENGKGPYVNDTLIRRPTGLHLYIYLLERYYMGLPEEQCCLGTSGVLQYAKEQEILYMTGELAYKSNGKAALTTSGGATSIYMTNFWGHDENLMYFRNHCYPYMSAGWGATSDYILLSDGDSWDVAMFTNWNFHQTGYFTSFDQDCYTVAQGGGKLTVKTQKWGTTAATKDFEAVNGSEGLGVYLYDSQWQEIATLTYDSSSSNTISLDVPQEDGVYYLLAMDPNVASSSAKIAPAAARIVVGGNSGAAGSSAQIPEGAPFTAVQANNGNAITIEDKGTVEYATYGQIPYYHVVIPEGAETVTVTHPASTNPYTGEDWETGKSQAYGYFTDADTFGSQGYITLDYTMGADGAYAITFPLSYEAYDYMTGQTVSASFVTGGDTLYAVGAENTDFAPIAFFTFEYGTPTSGGQETPEVYRILLDSYNEQMLTEATLQMTATVLPAEATGWTIQWKSSNEAAATVDQTGKITAVAEGTATITASIGQIEASCNVTVTKYNSAPSIVSGTAKYSKIKVNTVQNLNLAAMFTDAENDALTYTVQVCKATSLGGSWEYNYTAVDGFDTTVTNGKFSVSFPEIGIYAVKITAYDGKLSTTHTYQLTVVDNDAGKIKLNDGVTMDLYNVVAVGYSTEFAEDFAIPHKGTHDTTIHHIVLSKDTLSGTPSRKFTITLESGYQWGQYSASGRDSTFQTRADIGVFAYDPNLTESTAHFLQFHTECETHTDVDKNCVCDKCTMQLPAAGQFALMAVNADGFVIEPCFISYAEGATVKEALKNSGHSFTGIDSGFISAIDGKTDNYSLHYDGDGYSLDAAASGVTAIWFTTNASQAYSEDLLKLTEQMAEYNTSTNGVKDYPAAQQAYAAAAKDFYQTSKAAKLYTDLKNAMDKYDAFVQGSKVPVGLQITMGDSFVSVGKAVFTSEFGTTVETEDLIGVELVPGTYTFDISDGSFRHVRGTVDVEGAMVLTATLPSGTWMQSVELSASSGTNWAALPKANATEGSATFYVPDYADYSLYPYVERNAACTESDTSHKFYNGNSTSARAWASTSTALVGVIEDENLNDLTLVLECRQVEKVNGYELYQTFTIDIQRVPTLEELSVSGDGTKMGLVFDKDTLSYAVTTTATTVDVTAVALSEDASITVAGKQAVSGQSINITLADCQQNPDGAYLVPVVVTAPNGQSRTYTIEVTKVDPVQVTLIAPNTAVTVTLVNEAGAEIQPHVVQGPAHIYRVVPNQEYTYTVTANGCYHATAKLTPVDRVTTIRTATPKAEDWLGGMAAKAGSSKTALVFAMTPEVDPAIHSYTTQVESNTSAFYLQAYATDTSAYTTEAIYMSHDNTAYSDYTTMGRKEYVKTPGASSSKYVNMNNFMGPGGWGSEMLVRITQKTVEDGVTYYQDYTITVNRDMTLNDLSAKDNNGNTLPLAQKDAPDTTKFNKLVYGYTAKVGATTKEMSVSFKVTSSSRAYDFDLYTLTVACGDWSQEVKFESIDAASDAQTVLVPLSGTVDAQNVTVTVAHKATGAVAQTYTIELTKLPPVATTFTIDPADAVVFLTDDTSGGRVYPEADGTYILNTDASYTYVITRNGYVGQTASFIAGEANKTITVNLTKAPETSLKDISQAGDWLQFRADENNNGVVNVKTPIKAEDAVLEWANKIGEGMDSGATGCPIIVGGYLYTYAGKSIVKVNKDTGEVVDNGVMIGSSSFAINSPTYADGMLFVGLSGGRVQAFNAETLESLWVFTDTLGGQPNCPIVYCDGYIYTGFWNSETKQAHYVCLSVADEDPTQTTEAKLPTWTYTHNGFYWAGAYACEDFVLIGTDDGDSGYTAGYASILSLDPKTGALLDEEKLPNVGDQRSSICYDAATNAYYFTTKGGDFYQIKVNADGTFTENSLRRLHLDNGSDNTTNPPMSTSTPVIYNGRAYIGVSGTSQFGNYSGHNMTVIDLESFSIAYSVPTMGYPQTSGLLTTAYENADGYVYVYFIDNASPGMIRVIRDKKGMTEVDHSYTSTATITVNGQSSTIETGYILFTPYGDEAQYAICSPITDSEGNLYFKNDSARMMKLSSRMTSLEITQQPDKQVYCVGKTFDGTGMKVIAHYANGTSKDITQYVSFTTDSLTVDDTEITVSFAPDKMFEKNTTAAGGYWQWYRDVDGAAGQTYYLPTATVNIELRTEHTWDGGVQTDAPSCTETGNALFTCTVCGETKNEPIAADGHSNTKVNAQPSTCTEPGIVEHYHCSVCNKNFTDLAGTTEMTDIVDPADGHSNTKVDAQPSTCTEPGIVEHYHCSICNKNFTDLAGTTEMTDIVDPADGHSNTKVDAQPSTCTEPGVVEHYHCSVCSKNFTDLAGTSEKTDIVDPADGHKMTKHTANAPTCTGDGNVEYYTCSVCQKNFADEAGTQELITIVDPSTGHSMSKTDAKAPTCTEDGNVEYYTCAGCEKNFADEAGKTELTTVVDPAEGHKMTKTDAKAPTCTEDGNVEYYTCSECKKNFADEAGKTELTTVVDAAKGHTEVIDNAVAPSCSATGLTEGKHCDVCKEVIVKQETVAKTAHAFSKGKCSVCGESDPDYKPPVTPETGDTTPVVALTFVMLMSVTALAVLLLCYKKRRA